MFSWYNKSKSSQKILDQVNEDYCSLRSAISSFKGESIEPINKESLMSFPLFKWIPLDSEGKVMIQKRRMLFGDHLNFDTEMQQGGVFGNHFHDDLIESCEIISGRIKDLVDGRIYSDGDVMHWRKGQRHEPIALKKSMLKVIFKP